MNQKDQKKGFWFLAGILLVGLLTLPSYGFYLDQATEQYILFANVQEYLIQFFGDKGGLVQDLADVGVLRISENLDQYHGMAVYYPAFLVWYLNQASPYIGSLFWHAYTFLLVFWGMCSLYGLWQELFRKEKLSAFVVLLFFLTPRMFAESHYNNKDMVLLSLAFTLFYWGMRLMRKASVKNVCMFAFVGVLAANMRIVGAGIFGAVGLYALFILAVKREPLGKLLGKAAGCILLWSALFVLLMPACWVDAREYFDYLFSKAVDFDRWRDYVLFGGRMLQRDITGMPQKYLPVMMLITIPVGIQLLALCGGIFAMADFVRGRKMRREDVGYVLWMMFVGALPLAYAVLAATPLYNGWRHFYFAYASVIAAAGYGAFGLWDMAKGRGGAGRFRAAFCLKAVAVLYLASLAVGICLNFPQEHSYYNILAGSNVPERYELDYWDLSVKQAYESVLRQAGGKPATVGALNLPTRWGLNGNLRILPKRDRGMISLAEQWEDAEYVIVNTTYAYMYSGESYDWLKAHYGRTDSFASYGNVICEVYRRGK